MQIELDEIELSEGVVDFAMLCQKHGTLNVLRMLKECDKAMFDEIKVQINRLSGPALFLSFKDKHE